MSGALKYDPFSYALDVDPYPVYRRLRDEAPVYHNPEHDFWALSRYDDVRAASRDTDTFSSRNGTSLELMDETPAIPIMIFLDPPRHTAIRNIIAPVFAPARIAAMESDIRWRAKTIIADLVDSKRFDVVSELTARLPMDVISSLLGIPPSEENQIRDWSNEMLHRQDGCTEPPEAAREALSALWDYFHRAVAERRRAPRDDVMTHLAHATISDGGETITLGDDELAAFCILLASAGNETVTKALAATLYWLAEFPHQRSRLIEQPDLIGNAVEETLRYDPPAQYQGRTTTRAVEFHGQTIPANAKVALLTAATGRDERKFDRPDEFLVDRRIDEHLGFGHGRHICVGASLARLEMRAVLEEFLAVFPTYSLVEGGAARVHNSNVRGFSKLTLEVA